MAIRICGDNTVASPAITSASDTDTGLQFGTNEVKVVNGNLDITDGNLIVAAGHGIDFSADPHAAGMTSELFDDYEIGTWTPTINRATTSPSVTYTDREGKYVKVGDIVTCFFDAEASSISGGSGNPRITGLPFTVPLDHAGYSAIQWRSSNAFSAGPAQTILKGYAEQGQAYIVPQIDNIGTSGYGHNGNPSWGSLGRITGYITYQTGT